MNQHYVPRAYLKKFAEARGKDFSVPVFDKLRNRHFKANIKKICSEIDLYTLQEDNPLTKDLLTIEKFYANGFEPLYLKAYEILTNHSIQFISFQERAEILLGIFQLYVRNPAILNKAIQYHTREILKRCEEAKSKGIRGITYEGEDFSFRDWTHDTIINVFKDKTTRNFKEKHIGGLGELGDFHQNAIFEISVITDDSEFVTSDNPLVLMDRISDSAHPLQKSKEFILSLSKKVALKIYHDNRKQLNRIYRYEVLNGSVAIANRSIIEQATRFVITSKTVLDRHNQIASDFLDNTSLELKIDSMRQMISRISGTSENNETFKIVREYLNKYDNEGKLTDQEENELYLKLMEQSKTFIKGRIK